MTTILDTIRDFVFSRRDEAPTLAQETPPPVIEPETVGAAAGMSAPLAAPPLYPLYDTIDVEAILDEEAGAQNLNWRESVTDLLKLCGIPASEGNKHALAEELGCGSHAGDPKVIHALMRELRDEGGQVPEDLRE